MKQRPHAKRASIKSTLLLIALVGLTSMACAKLPRKYLLSTEQAVSVRSDDGGSATRLINLNLATRGELEQLPSIGKGLAARIVEHREKYGRFRRAEHLMMVRGISDRKFREMRRFITTE